MLEGDCDPTVGAVENGGHAPRREHVCECESVGRNVRVSVSMNVHVGSPGECVNVGACVSV